MHAGRGVGAAVVVVMTAVGALVGALVHELHSEGQTRLVTVSAHVSVATRSTQPAGSEPYTQVGEDVGAAVVAGVGADVAAQGQLTSD